MTATKKQQFEEMLAKHESGEITLTRGERQQVQAQIKSAGERTQRYAITHVDESGLRKLTFANQGRNHFDTREAAESQKLAVLFNNQSKTLEQLYGPRFLATVRVDQIECYSHGDAIKTILGLEG